MVPMLLQGCGFLYELESIRLRYGVIYGMENPSYISKISGISRDTDKYKIGMLS